MIFTPLNLYSVIDIYTAGQLNKVLVKLLFNTITANIIE